MYGPLLALLGASPLVVGAVTGAGEAVALVLRLVSGQMADRTRRYWSLTIIGYALTVVCVPLLALSPMLGSAGLAVAAALILSERLGKAIRSPAKSALLADAAGLVGMGRGMSVHKALDQIGALAGPLLVAVLVAASSTALGGLQLALTALAAPGAVAMVLLILTRRRMPQPVPSLGPVTSAVPSDPGSAGAERQAGVGLGRVFWRLAVAAALCTAGLVTFGLISFHLVETDVVPTATVPMLYAVAMGAGAVAALVTGRHYDRIGSRALLVLPALVASVPPLVFSDSLPAIITGVVLWGAAAGVQDSSVKALVADLVPRGRRATAYGLFAAVQGAGALVGGVMAGALYQQSLAALLVVVVAVQAVALVVLVVAVRNR